VKAAVPRGTNSLTVQFLDSAGGVLEEKKVAVRPRPGKVEFLSVRCFK